MVDDKSIFSFDIYHSFDLSPRIKIIDKGISLLTHGVLLTDSLGVKKMYSQTLVVPDILKCVIFIYFPDI